MNEDAKWIIWSIEHNAWWAPERRGYVTKRSAAGIYSTADALEIVEGANHNNGDKPMEAMVMVEWPDPIVHTMEDTIDLIVWDLETTGFDAPNAKITEIGAMIYRGKNVEHCHWVLDNKVEIPAKITEITGITNEIIAAEGRDPAECLNEFIPLLLKAKRNVTHNGLNFDIPFLIATVVDILPVDNSGVLHDHLRATSFDTAVQYKAQKLHLAQRSGESFLDYAHRVMSVRAYGVKFNLKLCCEEEKIDMSGITLHRALGDVAMTYQILKKTTYGKSLADLGIGD